MNVRRSAVVAVASLAVALAGVAGAFACDGLASLHLSAQRGPAGARITVTGINFSVAAPVLPVILNWNGTEGPELARATPDPAGRISATFTVPEGAAGYYLVVAVQKDGAGRDRVGTPTRASFQMLGPATAPATTRPPGTTAPRATTDTTTAPPATTSTLATTTSLALAPVAPVASTKQRSELPAPAVAVAGALLLGVAVALRRQAPGR